jgi:hypothetical protein
VVYAGYEKVEAARSWLTVPVDGSFGTLHHAILAFTALPVAGGEEPGKKFPLLAEDLLGRGFRPARSTDLEDIVLKAQLADGSIRCRVSSEGLVFLLVDNNLVWSRQLDPDNPEAALWLMAAQTRDVTLTGGDLLTAKVPTEWISWRE